MPRDSNPDPHRRRLARVIAAGPALPLAYSGQWTRPIVESVVLPAHARTSERSVTCTILNQTTNQPVAEGGPVPAGNSVQVTFTVLPNPGPGFPGTYALTCDGIDGTVPNNLATDANGQAMISVTAGYLFCGAATQEGIRATFDGIREDCSWVSEDI